MRNGGGKAKGGEFERYVCKELSKWISKGKRNDLFWRSAMSGGRATVQRKKGEKNNTQAGDISSVDPMGSDLTQRFFIECKFYRDLNLLGALDRRTKRGIVGFWKICRKEAKNYKKLPMLIAKQNQLGTYVVLNWEGAKHFGVMGFEDAHFPRYAMYLFELSSFLSAAQLLCMAS